MKNFLIISNFILLFLVAILYYLYFKSTKQEAQQSKTIAATTVHTGNKVAYIDLDSLQNNYEYYKKIKGEYERKQVASNDEISGMQKRYQNRAMQLQQKGPTMNQQEQESAMKEINQMQQDLQTKKQSLDNELFNYNSKMKEDILTRIQNYLKEYNSNGKYDYIFSYEPGFMFYKDTSLNITNDVISGLNSLYSKNKK
ncbi:MAG: OmpH family outer membrane protein [Ginsengibacter sp.]